MSGFSVGGGFSTREGPHGGGPVGRVAPPVDPPRPKPAAPGKRRGGRAGSAIIAVAIWLGAGYSIQEAARRALGEFWIAYPSETSLERAIEVSPRNHVGWVRWGVLQANKTGDPRQSLASLERAVELKPGDSIALATLGLQLEAAGEPERAEEMLLRGAASDLGFQPRWALANFYLRAGNEEAFWKWIREAVDADPTSLRPAVQLCWRVSDDPGEILSRAVPEGPETSRRYMEFLLERENLTALNQVWERLRPHLVETDLPAATSYVNRLVGGREVGRSVEVWNELAGKGLIPHEPLSPSSGPYLTNGDLSKDLDGWGFNWSAPNSEGIRTVHRRKQLEAPAIEFEMSGTQPERVPLMSQPIPLTPNRTYRLSFEYATENLPQVTGMRWALRPQPGLGGETTPSIPAAVDVWDTTSFDFQSPPDSSLAFLELEYSREPGTPRQNGRFVVRDISLTQIDESDSRTRTERPRVP